MVKPNQRVGNPAEQAVPWGLAQTEQPAMPEFAPTAIEPPPNVAIEPQKQSVFDSSIKTKSVFAPKVKPVVVEEKKVYPLGETDPSWIELVRFCQKHGEAIIQAHYPHPRGDCIDTIYRGVTVIAHPTTQVRHKLHGWIDWKDAVYE